MTSGRSVELFVVRFILLCEKFRAKAGQLSVATKLPSYHAQVGA
jgi:hypothetical protein